MLKVNWATQESEWRFESHARSNLLGRRRDDLDTIEISCPSLSVCFNTPSQLAEII